MAVAIKKGRQAVQTLQPPATHFTIHPTVETFGKLDYLMLVYRILNRLNQPLFYPVIVSIYKKHLFEQTDVWII